MGENRPTVPASSATVGAAPVRRRGRVAEESIIGYPLKAPPGRIGSRPDERAPPPRGRTTAGPAARRRWGRRLRAALRRRARRRRRGTCGGNWRTTNFGSAIDDPGAVPDYTLLDAAHVRRAALHRRERLLAHLRADARRQHGARLVLPPRRLHRVRGPAADDGHRASRCSRTRSTRGSGSSRWLVAMACIGLFGLAIQQLLLRWNQGQDLRQALITIAVSVIVADQVIAHFPRHVPEGSQQFGGNAVSLGWPGWTNRLVDLQVWGVQYSLARLDDARARRSPSGSRSGSGCTGRRRAWSSVPASTTGR